MNRPIQFGILVGVVIIIAVFFRVPQLDIRPMHCDEAIHAVKFAELLEDNSYRYDPVEYHGPTLNYFTLIPAWISGQKKYSDLNEFTLRIVPVFFGLALVCMPLFFIKAFGKTVVFFMMVFTAVSPAFVFYSRYYIQEMLLVCFTLGLIVSCYRYIKSKNVRWALAAGVFLGLMHATKETCIISLGAMFLSAVFVLILQRGKGLKIREQFKFGHLSAAVVIAVFVSSLFYSSFFTNLQGIADSIRTYSSYISKANQNRLHLHPWHYYLQMLMYYRFGTGPAWSEAFILLLALAGAITAMLRIYLKPFDSALVRFVAIYTLIMTIVYSAIPYKTPWSMLSFYHGMIMLASIGTALLINISRNLWRKTAVNIILAVSVIALGCQSWLGNYSYYAEPANPYVYAHPTNDIFIVTEKIKEISKAHPDGQNMPVHLICQAGDYWPFHWYLRDFNLNRVGWWSHVEMNTPAAPLIVASVDCESDLIRKLYEVPPPGQRNMYVRAFDSYVTSRPQIAMQVYVAYDLWEDYLRKKVIDE
jgi:uncharacterized protein (TIGR03663 family)